MPTETWPRAWLAVIGAMARRAIGTRARMRSAVRRLSRSKNDQVIDKDGLLSAALVRAAMCEDGIRGLLLLVRHAGVERLEGRSELPGALGLGLGERLERAQIVDRRHAGGFVLPFLGERHDGRGVLAHDLRHRAPLRLLRRG